MSNLDALSSAFADLTPAVPAAGMLERDRFVSGGYERRLRSLRRAQNAKYARCLDGGHEYPSDSEASLAVVDAMVARHFTDGEIWTTLEASRLFRERVERKGEKHALELYAREIQKARMSVTPLPQDPAERVGPKVLAPSIHPGVRYEQPPPLRLGPPPLVVPAGNDFMSRYMRYAAARTDAPLEAHQLMAAVLLSAFVGPQVRLPIATSRKGWNLCLWGMYIVNSTVGRKTTVIGLAREVVVEVLGADALIEWEGSPQGIIQRLQERDGRTTLFTRDEYSGLLGQMNRAGGHMAGMAQMLIKAFDGGVLENIRTKKKVTKTGPKVEDTDRVEMPYLPQAAASTWDSFMERATIDNVLDGLLARFVFVTGAADPRPLPLLDASMNAEFDAVVAHAALFASKAAQVAEVSLDPEIVQAAWELEQRWLREAEQTSRPDAAGPAMKRLSEAVLKLAALFAIDQAAVGQQPRVSLALFAEAEEIGERWKFGTIKVVESLGATSFMRDVEAVRATIDAHPRGIPLRDVSRKHRRLRQRDFDEIIETLAEREHIEVVQVNADSGRGRSKRVAYPYGAVPGAEQ